MAAAKTLYSGRLIPGENIIKKLIKDTTLENLL